MKSTCVRPHSAHLAIDSSWRVEGRDFREVFPGGSSSAIDPTSVLDRLAKVRTRLARKGQSTE